MSIFQSSASNYKLGAIVQELFGSGSNDLYFYIFDSAATLT